MGVCCLVGVGHASLSMLPAAYCAVVAPLLVTQQQSSCVDSKVTGEEEEWRLSPRGGLSTDRGLVWLAIKASLEFGVRYLGGGGSDLIASLDSSQPPDQHPSTSLSGISGEGVVLILRGKKKSVGLRRECL